jgi:hypothetical protein
LIDDNLILAANQRCREVIKSSESIDNVGEFSVLFIFMPVITEQNSRVGAAEMDLGFKVYFNGRSWETVKLPFSLTLERHAGLRNSAPLVSDSDAMARFAGAVTATGCGGQDSSLSVVTDHLRIRCSCHPKQTDVLKPMGESENVD